MATTTGQPGSWSTSRSSSEDRRDRAAADRNANKPKDAAYWKLLLQQVNREQGKINSVIWSLKNGKPNLPKKTTDLENVELPNGGRGNYIITYTPRMPGEVTTLLVSKWLAEYNNRKITNGLKIKIYSERLAAAESKEARRDTPVTTSGDLPGDVTVNSLYKKVVRYNASSVRNAYLQGGNTILGSPARVVNTPKQVENANNLWADSNGYKGMIQMWVTPFDSDTSYTNPDTKQKSALLERYGFQFLYNPGTVTMQYRGVENMDVTMYSAGLAKTNLYPSGESLGTIAFDLLINRMADIPLYNSDGSFKPGMGPAQYPVKPRDEKEYQEIYNKGTMYDVEFLLRTLLGFGMKSDDWTNRNTLWDGNTADMGFVFPRPVELHLGKTMRYIVQISAFTLKHVIFDDRMVPLFTTISLACTRIPDYPSSVGDSN